MADKIDFPAFLFHVSKIADSEAKDGFVEIPVLRLWISKEDFYDLNVDDVFTALDNGDAEQKSSIVEIFNNKEGRSMVFNCNFKTETCEYFISGENKQIKSLDDIEKRSEISFKDLKASLADFIISYGKWAEKTIDSAKGV